MPQDESETIGAWAKRCYFAGRAAMDIALRPYGVGTAQWYILHKLHHDGPTMQRDLLQMLQVERATLSGMVAALVRKGLVEQVPDTSDLRKKCLQLTETGTQLWDELPDLRFIHDTAFGGLDPVEVETAIRVLRHATQQLDILNNKRKDR